MAEDGGADDGQGAGRVQLGGEVLGAQQLQRPDEVLLPQHEVVLLCDGGSTTRQKNGDTHHMRTQGGGGMNPKQID